MRMNHLYRKPGMWNVQYGLQNGEATGTRRETDGPGEVPGYLTITEMSKLTQALSLYLGGADVLRSDMKEHRI